MMNGISLCYWCCQVIELYNLKNLDVDGRIILEWREIGWKGVVWLNLAHDFYQWLVLVNTE
jgi:hypothetical protein